MWLLLLAAALLMKRRKEKRIHTYMERERQGETEKQECAMAHSAAFLTCDAHRHGDRSLPGRGESWKIEPLAAPRPFLENSPRRTHSNSWMDAFFFSLYGLLNKGGKSSEASDISSLPTLSLSLSLSLSLFFSLIFSFFLPSFLPSFLFSSHPYFLPPDARDGQGRQGETSKERTSTPPPAPPPAQAMKQSNRRGLGLSATRGRRQRRLRRWCRMLKPARDK